MIYYRTIFDDAVFPGISYIKKYDNLDHCQGKDLYTDSLSGNSGRISLFLMVKRILLC